MSTFGAQTVTAITTTGTDSFDSLGMPTVTTTRADIPGCRHRPLRFDETPEFVTNTATQVWKTTAPPTAAALAVGPNAVLEVAGIRYKVIAGAQPFTDFSGQIHKVTILSQLTEA